jgi:BlaI family transcriptional regulator, penicillinase repressor
MPNLPQISDAEWDVMKVVWDHGPLTAGEVVRHLAAERRWSPRTVKTLLSRLVKKGAAEVRTEEPDATAGGGGRRFLYRARVSREACVRRESRSFLSRVFDGSVAPALLHFLEVGRLTKDEIRLLRETLRREEASAGNAGTDIPRRPDRPASARDRRVRESGAGGEDAE